jgi:fimbrial isopeptide formation D2 family protein/uncharacterized repeat protein (TIGR01451 family)
MVKIKNAIFGAFYAPLTLAFILLATWAQSASAEGSKELVSSGGDRPYTEWTNLKTADINRQTLLRVYVKAGETVNLGSSVPESANNPHDIVVRGPGSFNFTCDVDNTTGFGFIDTLVKESNGPQGTANTSGNTNPNGYKPCTFKATIEGIYEVEFRSPYLAPSGNPTPVSITGTLYTTQTNQQGGVAAWDITVRDANNTVGSSRKGRVFTNYIAMNMGANARQLSSQFYIQTKDGYRYRTDMNNVDPFGFIFFSNNRGFIDKTNNSTLYHSAKAPDNSLNPFYGNVQVQRPDVPDTTTDTTHLVFFNLPDTDTLVFLGIPTVAPIPPTPTNFQFVGPNGTTGNQTYVGVGGNFVFDVPERGSYSIIIDTNNDGIYDQSSDRLLQNIAVPGTNSAFWDGKDASGNNVSPLPNNNPYNAQIKFRAGEYHFPMLDAENNASGFIIEMLNAPGSFPLEKDQNESNVDRFTVYYNDSNYTTANNTLVSLDGTGAPSPRNATRGVNSAGGAHRFSSNYGDFKGMDTWTFFPSQAILSQMVVTASNRANVQGTKSAQFWQDVDGSGTVTIGDRIRYRITYSNLSPANSNATNAIIRDTLPSQLTYFPGSVAIISQTAGNTITLNPNYNGTAANNALTNVGTLRVGDTIVIEIAATINSNSSSNPIPNQATITFNTPDNPATYGTVITDASSAGGTSQAPKPGQNFSQLTDNGINTGNDPSLKGDDDPTLITTASSLVLVKRITQIKNEGEIKTFSQFVDDPNLLNDNDANWPAPLSTYLRGEIDSIAKPKDEIEYTIYFLSNGGNVAKNVQLCDPIPNGLTFILDGYNTANPRSLESSVVGGNTGIALAWSSTSLPVTPTIYLTNLNDGDRGQYYLPNDPATPLSCKKIDPVTRQVIAQGAAANTNGAIVVNIARNAESLPPATGAGTPVNSYGFIRFRARVK